MQDGSRRVDQRSEAINRALMITRHGPGSLDAWANLANLLIAEQRFDEALGALRRCHELAPEDPGVAHTLSALLHDTGYDDEALAMAAKVPPSAPQYLDSLQVRAACQLGLNTAPREAATTDLGTALLANGNWRDPSVLAFVSTLADGRSDGALRAFCEAWMRRHGEKALPLMRVGCSHFEEGNLDDCLRAFERAYALAPDEFAPLIGDYPETVSPLSAQGEDRLRRRVDAASDSVKRGRRTPPGLGILDHAPHSETDGLRLVFLGPSTKGRGLPNEVMVHFRDSGAEVGLDVVAYGDDVLFAPWATRTTDAVIARQRAALGSFLEESAPDVVLLDCPFQPTPRTFNPDDLERAAARGTRIVHFVADARAETLPMLRAWAVRADAFLLIDPYAALLQDRELASRALLIPLPVERSRYHPPVGDRHQELSFVGATNVPMRLMIVAKAKDSFPDMALHAGNAGGLPTMDAYAAALRDSQTTINVSVHSGVDRIMTGRVWEAIACGSLVLEQENPCTRHYFVPYAHYMPYESVSELLARALFLRRNPSHRARMAEAARQWHDRHYSNERVWAAILAHVFGGR